jgi:hypothetical protein
MTRVGAGTFVAVSMSQGGDIGYTPCTRSDAGDVVQEEFHGGGSLPPAPIVLERTSTVKARARDGNRWSALAEARFIAGAGSR